MEPIRDPEVMRRMELAFDLYEFADQLMRQNLRRKFPEADEAEIQGRLIHWLQKRPGFGGVPPDGEHRAPDPAPTRFHRGLQQLAEDLSALGRQWSIVGGVAIAARTEPQLLTPEIETIVATRDDAEPERVVAELLKRNYRVVAHRQNRDTGDVRAIRLLFPTESDGGLVLDLLFSSVIGSEVVAGAEFLDLVPGLRLPVARTGHLLAMNVLTRRRQEIGEIQLLRGEIEPDEIDRARHAIELIHQHRGQSGRNLTGEIERLLRPPADFEQQAAIHTQDPEPRQD